MLVNNVITVGGLLLIYEYDRVKKRLIVIGHPKIPGADHYGFTITVCQNIPFAVFERNGYAPRTVALVGESFFSRSQ